ncbi:MAG: hypothetical protein ACM3NQ_20005, partial [Bacteroidales bacterium]
MPSPVGHAMAGLITAWVGDAIRGYRPTQWSGPAPDVRPPHADSDPSDETSAAVGRRSFLARVADSITPLAVACA